MSVAFYKGQQLGSEDLNIFLEDTSGVPTNAAEIVITSYSIHYTKLYDQPYQNDTV